MVTSLEAPGHLLPHNTRVPVCPNPPNCSDRVCNRLSRPLPPNINSWDVVSNSATTCKQGHDLTAKQSAYTRKGKRYCRVCAENRPKIANFSRPQHLDTISESRQAAYNTLGGSMGKISKGKLSKAQRILRGDAS